MTSRNPSGSSPISHVIVIIQENRTFNNLFATFPEAGVTGATSGLKIGANGRDVTVKLTEGNLQDKINLTHSYSGFLTAFDNGKLDAFNKVQFASHKTEGNDPYEYVNPSQIQPYWSMAQQYGLANAMFATQGSESFPAHQDLIRGGTEISPTESMIDNPPYSNGVWGCDSPKTTRTSLISIYLQLQKKGGPFPCSSNFPNGGASYTTLRDTLDAAYVSWKYYAPQLKTSGAIWSAFDVISPVRYGPEWSTNVSSPETNVLSDISSGNLPQMSWVVPDGANSDHPGSGADMGPSWVASIVNAVGNSQYWNSCAIVVVWDDWGGFYDPVVPPVGRDTQGGPGLRVPMIVISPYARETSSSQPGYVSQTFYEFGSIVRFVEQTFNLPTLGTTDGTSNSISDMFNFNQSPRPFQAIGSKYSRAHFLHEKHSNFPPDDD
ncbi:MAG TPA: alkaline phosphatase family protein [Candidatus Cybelea sp.]|nr:alkaline phosphatase family protein [Candidatus Cybelea sp.]